MSLIFEFCYKESCDFGGDFYILLFICRVEVFGGKEVLGKGGVMDVDMFVGVLFCFGVG